MTTLPVASPTTSTPQPAPPVAVRLSGVRKEFRQGRRTMAQRLRRLPDRRTTVAAVEGIDLEVPAGEILGLLGPNGAGKTTLVRMLSTLLAPTSGTISVLGLDAVAEPRAVRERLGAVLGGAERSVYWKLTARENLQYFAALHQIRGRSAAKRIDVLLDEFQLADRADDYVERYSTGMRQRLAIARSLLADPAVLLLDEPTVALDPQSAANVRDHIRRLRAQGRTILLTTHDMDEAEQLSDRVAVIDHGRLIALGTVGDLKSTVHAEQIVRVDITSAPSDLDKLSDGLDAIGRTVIESTADGMRATVHHHSHTDVITDVVDVVRGVGANVAHLDVMPVTLEHVFFALTGRDLRE